MTLVGPFYLRIFYDSTTYRNYQKETQKKSYLMWIQQCKSGPTDNSLATDVYRNTNIQLVAFISNNNRWSGIRKGSRMNSCQIREHACIHRDLQKSTLLCKVISLKIWITAILKMHTWMYHIALCFHRGNKIFSLTSSPQVFQLVTIYKILDCCSKNSFYRTCN